MNAGRALDVTSQEMRIVPYCAVFAGGFPCQAKAACNSNRGANRTCIQDGTESTGVGFAQVKQYLSSCHPKLVILENVPTLAGDGEDEFVVAELRGLGYFTMQVSFDARLYGSVAARSRIYFIGVLTDPQPDETLAATVRLEHSRWMQAMQLGEDIFQVSQK